MKTAIQMHFTYFSLLTSEDNVFVLIYEYLKKNQSLKGCSSLIVYFIFKLLKLMRLRCQGHDQTVMSCSFYQVQVKNNSFGSYRTCVLENHPNTQKKKEDKIKVYFK